MLKFKPFPKLPNGGTERLDELIQRSGLTLRLNVDPDPKAPPARVEGEGLIVVLSEKHLELNPPFEVIEGMVAQQIGVARTKQGGYWQYLSFIAYPTAWIGSVFFFIAFISNVMLLPQVITEQNASVSTGEVLLLLLKIIGFTILVWLPLLFHKRKIAFYQDAYAVGILESQNKVEETLGWLKQNYKNLKRENGRLWQKLTIPSYEKRLSKIPKLKTKIPLF